MSIHKTALIAAMAFVPAAAFAQTDYFNTDRGRPLQVQDAIPIERYAFELQAAPLRWTRSPNAHVTWSIEPELAYGILPRTQLEIGLPVFFTEGQPGVPGSGVGALHVSMLHALNIETLGMPAVALTAVASIPAGSLGPRRGYFTAGAVATRTVSLGRVHLNADATLGDAIAADDSRANTPGVHDLSRWSSGVAVDHALPLRSMLVGGEILVRQPLVEGTDLQWQAATGVRWQLDPYWALDAGLGRSFGDEPEWSLTFGAARSFGILKLFPLGR